MKRTGFRRVKPEPSGMTGGVPRKTIAVSPKTALRATQKGKSSKVAPKSTSKLKKALDAIFSKYIRTKYSINGTCYCYTCNKPMLSMSVAQCGHFVSRTYLITRWDERNTRPQCAGCNIFGNGKPLDFEENLKRELGEKVVEEMKASRHKIVKLSPAWYEEKIEFYKKELAEL